jgi:hypothetical protein
LRRKAATAMPIDRVNRRAIKRRSAHPTHRADDVHIVGE